MQIIIIGGGTVGAAICKQLSSEGHDLTVIDTDQNTLNEISNVCDVFGIAGNGADVSILREAGAEKADLLIALTLSDEINILACAAAKKLGTNHTLARVRTPEYDELMHFMKEEMNLSFTVNPDLAVAKSIHRMLRFPALAKVDTFCHGRVELVEFTITKNSPLCSKKLIDLRSIFHYGFLVCAVLRNGVIYIPSGDFCLETGDEICITASEEDLPHLLKEFRLYSDPVKNVLIVGGGRTTHYLQKMLYQSKIRMSIIEKDKARCRELAERYPCTVICDDGTKQDLLLEEGLEQIDAFLAISDSDEENAIISMYAKTVSRGKIITRINSMSYAELFKDIGLDGIISPQTSTVNNIVRYVRSVANAHRDETSEIESLHRFMNDCMETLEFRIKKDIEGITNIPLKFLLKRHGILIACIVRNNRVIIPYGNDEIRSGDTVIVVTAQGQMKNIKDILR
jgi:trk system potassium uptake protein TrkA